MTLPTKENFHLFKQANEFFGNGKYDMVIEPCRDDFIFDLDFNNAFEYGHLLEEVKKDKFFIRLQFCTLLRTQEKEELKEEITKFIRTQEKL